MTTTKNPWAKSDLKKTYAGFGALEEIMDKNPVLKSQAEYFNETDNDFLNLVDEVLNLDRQYTSIEQEMNFDRILNEFGDLIIEEKISEKIKILERLTCFLEQSIPLCGVISATTKNQPKNDSSFFSINNTYFRIPFEKRKLFMRVMERLTSEKNKFSCSLKERLIKAVENLQVFDSVMTEESEKIIKVVNEYSKI
jgi:hypothetical protein